MNISPRVLKLLIIFGTTVLIYFFIMLLSNTALFANPDAQPYQRAGTPVSPTAAQDTDPSPSALPVVIISPSPTAVPAEHTPDADTPDTTPATPEDDAPIALAAMPVLDINTVFRALAGDLNAIAKNHNCVAVSLAAFSPDLGYTTYTYGLADRSEEIEVTTDTKFRVASISKVVGAIVAMTLVDEGKLDLDEDISVYLNRNVRNPNYPRIPITSRMLITHTSSIFDTKDYEDGKVNLTADGLWNHLARGSSYSGAPGYGHRYTNIGYVLLGAVIEAISEKQLDILAREVLFEPLGIDAAFAPHNLFDKNVAAQYSASHGLRRSAQTQIDSYAAYTSHRSSIIGNLTITALDYAKILNMLIHGGIYDNVRILSQEAVDEMHKAEIIGDYRYNQGLSVRLVEDYFFDDDVYYHTGSAYGTLTQFFYSLETGRICVVFTTGATSTRERYNSIVLCNNMTQTVWDAFESMQPPSQLSPQSSVQQTAAQPRATPSSTPGNKE